MIKGDARKWKGKIIKVDLSDISGKVALKILLTDKDDWIVPLKLGKEIVFTEA